MSIQLKMAELEGRIAALEKAHRQQKQAEATITQTIRTVSLEPEMSNIWKSIDALFKKAFR